MKICHFWIAWCFALLWGSAIALGQENLLPLKPPDRSSPRATLTTFLTSADQVGEFVAKEYRASPSRAGFNHIRTLAEVTVDCLDLSELAPAARPKGGAAAALALYETLSRINLPPLEKIPGPDDLKSLPGDPPRWVIPNTEITLVRLNSGPHTGEFVFSPHTVANAESYHLRAQHLPYARPVPIPDIYDLAIMGGGYLIPPAFIQALPAWLRTPVLGDALWKWVALALTLILLGLLLRVTYGFSRRIGDERPFLQAIVRLTLPVFILLATPVFAFLTLLQINLRGPPGTFIQLATTATLYLAGAWLSWRIADAVAEAIISSPHIKPRSIDAHLTRICTRLAGFSIATILLVAGADRVGVPVYGVIAGLSVGGLAVALATQPTIENLIGGLNIFADRPVRVGQQCKLGTDVGTVEEIGIRSTRIRGADRTLTTVPNGMLSKMAIVNLTERERMLIRTVITVPYDGNRERIRYLLARVQQMLLEHPEIEPTTAHARLTNFTGNVSEIEVVAYALTRDATQFLTVQEDVFLRLMEIHEQSKSVTATPSPVAAATT